MTKNVSRLKLNKPCCLEISAGDQCIVDHGGAELASTDL